MVCAQFITGRQCMAFFFKGPLLFYVEQNRRENGPLRREPWGGVTVRASQKTNALTEHAEPLLEIPETLADRHRR